MFITETLKGDEWKRDRKYQIFENAEKRVYALYSQGVDARMIEVKR